MMPTIQVNDINVNYEISGQGEPLLFIHGLGSSCRDWEKQTPHFVDRFQVIAMDLRGHGKSAKPPGPYSLSQFAGDMAELMCVLGIPYANVAGISMGGMVAFELVTQYPQLVTSLTIVNSYPETRVDTLRDHLLVWRRFFLLEVLGVKRMGAALAKHLFPHETQAELRTLFVERWAKNDKRAYRESLRAIVNWDVEDYLGDIICPVLVVASEYDYFPLEEKKAYVNKIPNARLEVIKDARHAVTAEKPEEFNILLKVFLKSVS